MPTPTSTTLHLVRRFAIVGAVVMLLSAALIAPVHYYIEQRDMTRSAEDYNENLANILAFLTRSHIQAFLREADKSENPALLTTIQRTLDGAFGQLGNDSKLLKVKLYDARGLLIYSTDPSEIGEEGDEDDDGFNIAFKQHVIRSDRTFREKMTSLRGNLTDVHVVASYVPIFTDANNIEMLGLFELYSDVTEREHAFRQALIAEMALIVLVVSVGYAGLLAVIWLGARDIERSHKARIDLTARMSALSAEAGAKTRLLMSMSHHLKTPLNAIIGFSEMIAEQRLGAVGDKRYADFAGDILHSGRHLLRGVDNILDYVRVDSDRFVLGLDTVSPRQIMAAAARDHDVAASAGQVSLIVEATTLDQFVSDPRLLRQILGNVIDNAIRYNRPGGHVWLACTTGDSDGVRFTVTDDGIGIAEKDLAGVFQPFGTKTVVLTQVQDGFGIGLPLSQRLAELLGGTLVLERRKAGGTVVILDLPRQSYPVEADASRSSASEPA